MNDPIGVLDLIKFEIDDSLDASLLDLCKRILPCAIDYLRVDAFVEMGMGFGSGRVWNALAGCLRGIIKVYIFKNLLTKKK